MAIRDSACATSFLASSTFFAAISCCALEMWTSAFMAMDETLA